VRRVPQLSNEDWIALEKLLGHSLTPNQRLIADRLAALAAVQTGLEKEAMTTAALRKNIKLLGKKVLSYRNIIWHVYNQNILERPLSIESVDELFFMRPFRIGKEGALPLVLLGWAMDALIATCLSVEREIRGPDHSTTDREWFAQAGAMLRISFKAFGLPHTIRKDIDKFNAKEGSSGSAFLDFYLELLKRIGCPWPLTSSALATAISRHGLSKYAPPRVDNRARKTRK
jgi:hypothetical protein